MSVNLSNTYNNTDSRINLETLLDGLPGSPQCESTHNPETSEHTIDVYGVNPATSERIYDCRFAFNFSAGIKASKIRNCSIHDQQDRGQGLGAKIVRNLLTTTQLSQGLRKITLTAELERGAFVWAKMGWLPNQACFSKLQRRCLPKLDLLQQLIPGTESLSSNTYGIFRDLLDETASKDPRYIWAIVDSNAAYKLDDLAALQELSRIENIAERRHIIHEKAAANCISLDEQHLTQADQTLKFLKDIDLNGLSRNGYISVAVILFAWETWKGELDLDNADQMQRIQHHLGKAQTYKATSIAFDSPKASTTPTFEGFDA